jgi:hypothetical protein
MQLSCFCTYLLIGVFLISKTMYFSQDRIVKGLKANIETEPKLISLAYVILYFLILLEI